jgi:hypothetical protein
MIDMLKRHEVQVLRRAGHSLDEIAKLAGVGRRGVVRIEDEAPVIHVDSAAERIRRKIGRPSKAEPQRGFVVSLLAMEPDLLSVEVLRRPRLEGCDGGKSALYELIHSIRPKPVRLMTRFEGLPGEFTQHDFGEVDVRFPDGSKERVHFFASRLKYSRWVEVSLVPNEQAETLARAMVDHFAAVGGHPAAGGLRSTEDGGLASAVAGAGPEPRDQARCELTRLAGLTVNPEVACQFGREEGCHLLCRGLSVEESRKWPHQAFILIARAIGLGDAERIPLREERTNTSSL